MRKRGIRGTSMRARLAVAAVVLAGGGAAGVVAVSANHSDSGTAAESAGYSQSIGRTLSYSSAVSSAMQTWGRSPSQSLLTLSHMMPFTNYWTQSWHHATLFFQRGTVIAVDRNEFVVQSANRTVEIWHVNGGTVTFNVGGSSTGMSALSGGSMMMPSGWRSNTTVKGLQRGDLVFVFGEKENHTLKAQLVLFAARSTTGVRPPVAPTATMTVTPTVAPTATTANPAMPTTTTAPTFSGVKS